MAAESSAKPKTSWTIVYILAAAVGVLALLALLTAPAQSLLGESPHAIASAMHGVSAIIYLLVATALAYLSYLMYTGRLQSYHDIRILASLNAFFSLLTILFGNWIYMAYRARGGPRARFLEDMPEIHQIFFEFKEFIALCTLPLAVAGAFILLRERDRMDGQERLRQATAVLLVGSWVFLLLAFGLGAAITKLRSV